MYRFYENTYGMICKKFRCEFLSFSSRTFWWAQIPLKFKRDFSAFIISLTSRNISYYFVRIKNQSRNLYADRDAETISN